MRFEKWQALGNDYVIVEEREPSGFVHERTLCLKTWHVDEQGAFTEFLVPRQAAREGTRFSAHSGGLPPKTEKGPTIAGGPFLEWLSGCVLLSHTVTSAVPSALKGLASGFGMEPGVSPSL